MVTTHISWVAVIVAAIVSVFWGWAWHACFCNKKWYTACGWHANLNKKDTRIATFLSFIAALLTAYVIHRFLTIAQTSTIIPTRTAYKYGLCVAFMAWIGFYVPMMLNATVWMKKEWNFFFSKIVFHFINLLIIAMILAYWTTISKV